MFPFTRTVLIFFIAGLLFIVLRARRTLGAYRIPRETGLLIPSGKRGDRKSQNASKNHFLGNPTLRELITFPFSTGAACFYFAGSGAAAFSAISRWQCGVINS